MNFGKLLHVAMKVAPHMIPIVALADAALKEGKKAARDHDTNLAVDAVSLATQV